MTTLEELSSEFARPGDYRIATEYSYKLKQRNFVLHVPELRPGERPSALVIAIHGAFSNAEYLAKRTGFNELSNQEGFLVAYPEGIGLFGFLQHWNAGHCCGKAQQDGVDDVGFITSVITMLQKKYAISHRRTYVVGMSNGGMLTYRLLSESPEIVGAGVVVAGAIGSKCKKEGSFLSSVPLQGVPLLIMHGEDDQHIPIDGGFSPLKGPGRSYLSLQDAIAYWLQINQCQYNPEVQETRQGAVRHMKWPCEYPLEVLRFSDWGHDWPAPFRTEALPKDHPLYRYDATRRIWEFLSISSSSL